MHLFGDLLSAGLLLAAALGGFGCTAQPPGADPPGPAPTGPLEITVFAPVEGLLCVGLPLRFVVRNTSNRSIAGLHVHCDLPQGLLTAGGLTAFDFDLGTLAGGESAEARVAAEIKQTGRFGLHATVRGEGGSSADSNSTSTLVGQPVLALSLAAPGQQPVGQDIACVLELTNTGDGTALDVMIEAQLPHGVSVASATEGARVSGDRVLFLLDKLAPKATGNFEMTLRGATVGTVRSTATAQAACAQAVGAAAETVITAEAAGRSPQ